MPKRTVFRLDPDSADSAMDGMEGANNYQAKKCNDFICSVAANAIASGLSFASGGLNRTTALVGQVYEKNFLRVLGPEFRMEL